MNEDFTFSVHKRPIWMWVAAFVWLLVEVVMLQTALASGWEFEGKAATISWVIFAVLLAAGIGLWLHRPTSRK